MPGRIDPVRTVLICHKLRECVAARAIMARLTRTPTVFMTRFGNVFLSVVVPFWSAVVDGTLFSSRLLLGLVPSVSGRWEATALVVCRVRVLIILSLWRWRGEYPGSLGRVAEEPSENSPHTPHCTIANSRFLFVRNIMVVAAMSTHNVLWVADKAAGYG